jgi:tRNA threonylcarbamoyladenosine biosynthesis protein TsaB
MVLGFDTATHATAVALLLGDGAILRARDDPGPGEHPGHATRLLPMAGELLAAAGAGWRDLDRVAVGVGPGAFTGLRVGVATARGLAQSLSVDLVGVSSPAALARAALAAPPNGSAFSAGEGSREKVDERMLAIIDARRGEIFAGAFRRSGGDGIRELVSARAIAPEHLDAVIALAQEHGAGPGRWLAAGDGAVRYREQLQGAETVIPEDSSPLHLIDAGMICQLGAEAPPVAAHEQILPDYRRRPDAELAPPPLAARGAVSP